MGMHPARPMILYLGGDFSAKKILLFNGAILPNAWVLFSVVDSALQAAVFKLWPKILHLIARPLRVGQHHIHTF